MEFLELSLEKSNQLIDDYFKSIFRKTDSRILLGNMNKLAKLYEHAIYYHGVFNYCDLSEIIHTLIKHRSEILAGHILAILLKKYWNHGCLA